MNLRRNFLLGASSIVIAGFATPSFSSDLPMPSMAEPITYVSTCDAFGAGYFQIPGKDTCLKIGGRIRSQIVSGNFMKNDDKASTPEEYSLYTRGYLYLDSMTALDIGTITTKAIMLYEWGEDSEVTPKFEDTYLQFSTGDNAFLVGRAISLFDGFIGYSAMGTTLRNFSEVYPVQANAIAHLSDGISLGFSVEDSEIRSGPTDMADFVAMAELKQSWGSFRITGGLHRNFANAYELPENNYRAYMAAIMPDSYFGRDINLDKYLKASETANQYGYGVNATATFNVPVTQNSTQLTFQATYMDSAISYLGGLAAFSGNYELQIGETSLLDTTADFLGLTGYSLVAGISHEITKDVTFGLDGSYAVAEGSHTWHDGVNTAISNTDISRMAIDGSVTWSPVAGLAFSVNAGYAQTEADYSAEMTGPTAGGGVISKGQSKQTFDEAYVGTRVQYTF